MNKVSGKGPLQIAGTGYVASLSPIPLYPARVMIRAKRSFEVCDQYALAMLLVGTSKRRSYKCLICIRLSSSEMESVNRGQILNVTA